MGLSDLVGSLKGLVGGTTRVTPVEPADLAVYRQRIPNDIVRLLWFSDGPHCNYAQKPEFESSSAFHGIKMTMSFFGPGEPSAISVKMPVVAPRDPRSVDRLGYYPNYEGMTPDQRWTYLNWLVDIDSPVDIGYVFVFYYGLERHLFAGLADQAVLEILRLRARHQQPSFTQYSSNAIIAASLVANRPDWLAAFAQTIDSTSDVSLSDVYLYAKYLNGFAISAPEVVALASRVGFSNRRYIKSEPATFESEVEKALADTYGDIGLLLGGYDISRCSQSMYPLFANYSLDRDRGLIKVPAFRELVDFNRDVHDLLVSAHEAVKLRLKEARVVQRNAETTETSSAG
jgi:hypothetical protein